MQASPIHLSHRHNANFSSVRRTLRQAEHDVWLPDIRLQYQVPRVHSVLRGSASLSSKVRSFKSQFVDDMLMKLSFIDAA